MTVVEQKCRHPTVVIETTLQMVQIPGTRSDVADTPSPVTDVLRCEQLVLQFFTAVKKFSLACSAQAATAHRVTSPHTSALHAPIPVCQPAPHNGMPRLQAITPRDLSTHCVNTATDACAVANTIDIAVGRSGVTSARPPSSKTSLPVSSDDASSPTSTPVPPAIPLSAEEVGGYDAMDEHAPSPEHGMPTHPAQYGMGTGTPGPDHTASADTHHRHVVASTAMSMAAAGSLARGARGSAGVGASLPVHEAVRPTENPAAARLAVPQRALGGEGMMVCPAPVRGGHGDGAHQLAPNAGHASAETTPVHRSGSGDKGSEASRSGRCLGQQPSGSAVRGVPKDTSVQHQKLVSALPVPRPVHRGENRHGLRLPAESHPFTLTIEVQNVDGGGNER